MARHPNQASPLVRNRDDETQGADTKGDSAEKTAKLTTMDGMYFFRRGVGAGGTPGSFKVRYVISESVSEPYTVLLLLAGLMLCGKRPVDAARSRVRPEPSG